MGSYAEPSYFGPVMPPIAATHMGDFTFEPPLSALVVRFCIPLPITLAILRAGRQLGVLKYC
jgi:hypothetical protein